MKKIPSTVEFNGLSIRFDRWISLFETQAPYNVKKVGFKRDLRYWNDSPWSLQPQKAIHLTKWSREGTVDLGVYQMSDSFAAFVIIGMLIGSMFGTSIGLVFATTFNQGLGFSVGGMALGMMAGVGAFSFCRNLDK